MMEMGPFVDSFRRLLDAECSPAVVRAIEAGGDWRPLWNAVAATGFLDALVAEEEGGAGLSLSDCVPIIELIGAHGVPLPVGETMVARALLAREGMDVPETPITLATSAGAPPLAPAASHALAGNGTGLSLVELRRPDGVDGLDVGGPETASALRPIAAVLRAVLISGAIGRVLEMTVAYANDRSQFGKPIGRQQAVQQQIAVLAEQAVAARVAAAFGARGGLAADLSAAAVAKTCAGTAAVRAASIAHAVFGAIGISEEHDLQLLTRRLHLWRLADGSEAYWSERLGTEMLAQGVGEDLPFPGRVTG